MKAFLQKEGYFWFSHGNLGADLSWTLAVSFTILFMVAWYSAREAKGGPHHTIILWAMLAMIGYFLFYYLSRQLGALAFEAEGQEGFGGPEFIYTWVFSPLLTTHIIVVSVGLVMAVYMIILGFRAVVKKNGNRMLQARPLSMSLGAFLKILGGAFALFALLSLIRCHRLACYIVYISGFLLVAIVLLIEKGIERWLPDGERRHRALGTFTMVLYAIALITSTATYFMLYVIWPPEVIG